MAEHNFFQFLGENLVEFAKFTGFANVEYGHIIMILIGLFFIYLAIFKKFGTHAAVAYRLRYDRG